MDFKKAYIFIVLLGLVSFLGDVIYEGIRGISGAYLHGLGASMLVVSITAGLGEFLGYSIRLFSGTIVDKLKAYWLFTFIGYGLLVSIPFLVFVDQLELAVFLILLERLGKGLRSPARDSIVSFVSQKIGRGMGFGITEALDQLGAILGPLIFLISYSIHKSYKVGFALMFIPFVLLMLILFYGRRIVPYPEKEERGEQKIFSSKVFYVYILFSFFAILSVPQYQVISYYFKNTGVISDANVMLFYMLAMFVDLVVALIVGKLYDIFKFKVLVALPFFTFILMVFSYGNYFYFAVISAILYGVIIAMHESIMRSAVADLTNISKRGFSYGIFNFIFGLGYFVGNVIIGFLYKFGYLYLLIFSGVSQIISIALFFYLIELVGKTTTD